MSFPSVRVSVLVFYFALFELVVFLLPFARFELNLNFYCLR